MRVLAARAGDASLSCALAVRACFACMIYVTALCAWFSLIVIVRA